MSDSTQTGIPRRPPWRRRDVWIVAAAVAVLGIGVIAVPSVMAFRSVGGHQGHGFGHRMLRDPEQARAHAAVAVEWAFRAVGATAQQQEEGRIVAERLIDQLLLLREQHLAHRQAMARELLEPQIDRAALEVLRAEGVGMADEASRIIVEGVADLAEVLSPTQRAELLELAHRFHGGGDWPPD